jgi:hypothetical protein
VRVHHAVTERDSMSRLSTRLARLESRTRDSTDRSQLPRMFVIWIGDPVPEDLRDQDLVIYLSRKAESEDAWMRQCEAIRRQQLPEEDPSYVPSL